MRELSKNALQPQAEQYFQILATSKQRLNQELYTPTPQLEHSPAP